MYACGPAPMLTGIRQRLAGRDDVELHFERFAAPPVIDGTTFTATAASTGTTMTVQPEETLLSALQRSGWPRRTRVSRASAAPAAPGCSMVLCSIGIRFSPTRSAKPA